MHTPMWRQATRMTVLSGLMAGSAAAFATSGAYLTGNGPAASGMGGVSIALPQDTAVAADNPAGMASVGSRLDIYGVLISTETDASFGTPANHFFSRVNVPVPFMGVNYQVAPDWTLGVSVTGAGLASHYNTPVVPVPGLGPAKASYTLVNTAPTVTYKPLPNLSLGASVIIGVEQFRANGLLGPAADGAMTPLVSHGNAYSVGVGGAFGVLWRPVPVLSVGASYFTKMNFSTLSGYEHDLLVSSGGRLNTPSHYGFGIAVQPLPALTIGVDYLRIEWSKAAGFDNPASFNWHDQSVVRFGTAYTINDRWTVRAGYSMASSFVDSNHTLANFYSPGVIDRAVTGGLTYSVDRSNEISLAIEYDIPRTIVGTGPSTGTNIRTNLQVYTLGYSHKF